MTALVVLLVVVLAQIGVLIGGAVSLLRDPHDTAASLARVGVRGRAVDVLAVGVPVAAIALASGLALLPGAAFAVLAWSAAALLTGSAVLVGAALARLSAPAMRSFGQWGRRPADRVTLLREISLAVLAVIVAVLLGTPDWPGLLAVVAGLQGDAVVEFVVLVSLALALAALRLRQSAQREELGGLRRRVEEMESRLGIPAAPALGPVRLGEEAEATVDPVPSPASRAGEQPGFPAAVAPTRSPWTDTAVPSAALVTEDGSSVDLAEAVADSGAQALVFWRSDCEYSASILPSVREGSARGSVLLVSTSAPQSIRDQGLAGPLLLSPDRAALDALDVPGTPVGFRVDGSRVVAGPFIGADAVRELVTATV